MDLTATEKRKQIQDLCSRIERILLGHEYPLSKKVFDNGRFSVDKVSELANDIFESGSDNSNIASNKKFIINYLEVVISFLFAECNREDCVIGSIFKLSNTFIENIDDPFDNTVLGVLINDAHSTDHYNDIDITAYEYLCEKEKEFRICYENRTKEQKDIDIFYMLEKYIINSNLAAFTSNERFEQTENELRRMIFKSKHITDSTERPIWRVRNE